MQFLECVLAPSGIVNGKQNNSSTIPVSTAFYLFRFGNYLKTNLKTLSLSLSPDTAYMLIMSCSISKVPVHFASHIKLMLQALLAKRQRHRTRPTRQAGLPALFRSGLRVLNPRPGSTHWNWPSLGRTQAPGGLRAAGHFYTRSL